MSAFAAVILVSLGFVAGWSFSESFGWKQTSGGTAVEETKAEEPPPRPVSNDPALPEEDVPGEDLEGLPRYPGSVRIEYIRQDQDELVWTETEYLTGVPLDEVREFYRDAFRTEEWSVNDIEFRQQSWIFFVVKDEREVFVELSARGDVVEIDIEQTEPAPRVSEAPAQQEEPGGTAAVEEPQVGPQEEGEPLQPVQQSGTYEESYGYSYYDDFEDELDDDGYEDDFDD